MVRHVYSQVGFKQINHIFQKLHFHMLPITPVNHNLVLLDLKKIMHTTLFEFEGYNNNNFYLIIK